MSSAKTESHEDQFNLDGILAELGSFGKYQVLLLLLLGFRDAFLLMCNLNYIFVADTVAFRCEVPECEESGMNSTWMSYALNDSATCFRTEPKIPYSDLLVSSNSCASDNFIPGQTIPCEKIVYENYNSPVAEFDLGCQPWKTALIGTTHNLGLVFSSVFYGLMSDKYGRKIIIVLTPLAVGVVGLLKSFSINYWMLLILEFIEAALGYGNASLVLSLEAVSQQNRVIFTCIGDSLANFGGAFFGLIAWKFPYWRHMIRAIYSPLLVVVFYIFLVDEGVRWLLAHNKHDEAVRVLNKVAKFNNIKFSNKAKEMLVKVCDEKYRIDEKLKIQQEAPPENPELLTALRSKKIIFRVSVISAGFFCAMFVYNGTTVNITRILGNKYWNYSAMSLLAIPTRIIIAITLTKFGRRAPICIAYSLCALCLISSAFLSHTVSWWSSVALYLLGVVCSTYALFSMTVVAMELFPTTSRNSLTNIAQTFGRLGGVLAPQTPLLEKYMPGLPSITFGFAALGSAALAMLLPDTSRSELPDNLDDAEHLDDVADDVEKEKPDGETRIDVSGSSKPIWTTSLDLRTEPRQSELSDVGCSP